MIKIIFNVSLYSLVIALLVSILVPGDTTEQFYYDVPIPPAFLDGPATPLYKDIDVFCMAKNIFHEAGTEPELGQYAVAQVTLNRVRDTSGQHGFEGNDSRSGVIQARIVGACVRSTAGARRRSPTTRPHFLRSTDTIEPSSGS